MRTLALAALVAGCATTLAACNENTAIGNDREEQLDPAPTPAPIMPPQAALENVATKLVKPETMSQADIAALGGLAGRCVVRLTEIAFPSFLYEPQAAGTIKLNGKLIPLPYAGPGRYAQGGLRVVLNPMEEEGDAGLQAMEMVLILPGAEDELGYSGFVQCYDGDEA